MAAAGFIAGDGDRGRVDCLLSDPGRYIFKKWRCVGGQTLQRKCVKTCLSSKNWPMNILHNKLDSTYFARTMEKCGSEGVVVNM